MPKNTGYKIYPILVEYDGVTNTPTGRTKPNLPSDPQYIAPILDTDMCPIGAGNQSFDIEVSKPTTFMVEFSIKYGKRVLSTTSVGVWTVPAKIYDEVLFNVSVTDPVITPYICYVVYRDPASNLRAKRALITRPQITLFIGPYFRLEQLIIEEEGGGSFADDFDGSFDI